MLPILHKIAVARQLRLPTNQKPWVTEKATAAQPPNAPVQVHSPALPASPRLVSHLLTICSTDIVVSPFRSFRAIETFRELLLSLPSVHAVHVRGLHEGALYLRIEGQEPSSILADLQATLPTPLRAVKHLSRIEIALETEEQEHAGAPNRPATGGAGA